MSFKLQTFKDVNMHSITIRHEWDCSGPPASYCWCPFSSAISCLPCLLQSAPFLARCWCPFSSAISSLPCLLLPVHPVPAPGCQLLCYTTVLCKVLYSKMKNVHFLCLFLMYDLCKKYYKLNTVQYYTADYVSCVTKLTLLDLRTNWTHETELVCMYGMHCVSLKRNY